MMQTKRSRIDRTVVSYSILSGLLCIILTYVKKFYFYSISKWLIIFSLMISIGLFLAYVLYKAHFHHLRNGISYMLLHQKIYSKLYRSLYDAHYYTEKLVFGKICAAIPKIEIVLNDLLDGGIIYVENSVKLDKRLEELPISSGLPNHFVLTRQYVSDNQNQYIYEFEKFLLEKPIFNDYETFKQFCIKSEKYNLILDQRYAIPMFHTLLVGQTGSGKSYALYFFILQMIAKEIPWNLYIIDPKYSGVYVIGSKINKDQTASDIEDSIRLLENFYLIMEERKKEMNTLLHQKLDSDYRLFNLTPICLIIDEYSAFRASLGKFDKKTRDRVDEIIGNTIREGRQLGCFCILAQQQTNAQNLPTEIKENIPCKIILGNAERQTYMTSLGCLPDIVNRNFKKGEGIFTYPEIATVESPLVITIPTMNFDILETVNLITKNREGGKLG